MAVKGKQEKEQIKDKILEVFDGSFIDDKVIRIPINGIEIKVSLTAAKDVIGGNASPASIASTATETTSINTADYVAPTNDEKNRVKELLTELGF